MLEGLPIMLALCFMLWHAYYAQNYAGIIDAGLPPIPRLLPSPQEHQLVTTGEGLPPIPRELINKIESGL